MAKAPNRINASMAAYILDQSTNGEEGALGRINDGLFGDGVNRTFNERQIEMLTKMAKDPKALIAQAIKTEANTGTASQVATAKSNLAAAKARLTAKTEKAARTGRRDPNMALDIAAIATAEMQLEALIGTGGAIAAAGFPKAEGTVVRRTGAGPRNNARAPSVQTAPRVSAKDFLAAYGSQPKSKLSR